MYFNTVVLAAAYAIVTTPYQARAQSTTSASAAGSCPTVLTSSGYGPPVVGSGYTAQLIATNLTKPRGLIFDKSGGLLVVESGVGITRLEFDDHGGTCLLKSVSSVVNRDSSVSDTA
jgi:hypothetical protein